MVKSKTWYKHKPSVPCSPLRCAKGEKQDLLSWVRREGVERWRLFLCCVRGRELGLDLECTPTHTHTKDSLVSRSPVMTEDLSTGVLDKAMGTCWGRAKEGCKILSLRAGGAVKTISAYYDSSHCLHEDRLQPEAVSGTDTCPGAPELGGAQQQVQLLGSMLAWELQPLLSGPSED